MDYAPGTETILLVEDEELLRDVVAEMLGDLGYRVLSASSGKGALGVANRFPGKIHLLITDVLMPDLDGNKLAEALRRQRPEMKVMFVSGDPNEPVALSSGMSRMDKPFSIKLLAAKVRELLQA